MPNWLFQACFTNLGFHVEDEDRTDNERKTNISNTLKQRGARNTDRHVIQTNITQPATKDDKHGDINNGRRHSDARADIDIQRLFKKLPNSKPIETEQDEFTLFKNFASGKSSYRPLSTQRINKLAMTAVHGDSKGNNTRPTSVTAATRHDVTTDSTREDLAHHKQTTENIQGSESSSTLKIPSKSNNNNTPGAAISKSTSTSASHNSSKQSYGTGPQQHTVLRSDVFYQNRLICLNNRDSNSSNSKSHDARGKSSTSEPDGRLTSGTAMSSDVQIKSGNRRNMEMDASSVTMDARGIEIILTDPENSSRPIETEEKEKNTICRKITRLLQDNRMKGIPDSERILNTGNPEEYALLKKVLNIAFLTIGIVLFLSVVVVVIYAFVGKYKLILWKHRCFCCIINIIYI